LYRYTKNTAVIQWGAMTLWALAKVGLYMLHPVDYIA
jgi:hypothetical protein